MQVLTIPLILIASLAASCLLVKSGVVKTKGVNDDQDIL
jgi:hypothetical protein